MDYKHQSAAHTHRGLALAGNSRPGWHRLLPQIVQINVAVCRTAAAGRRREGPLGGGERLAADRARVHLLDDVADAGGAVDVPEAQMDGTCIDGSCMVTTKPKVRMSARWSRASGMLDHDGRRIGGTTRRPRRVGGNGRGDLGRNEVGATGVVPAAGHRGCARRNRVCADRTGPVLPVGAKRRQRPSEMAQRLVEIGALALLDPQLVHNLVDRAYNRLPAAPQSGNKVSSKRRVLDVEDRGCMGWGGGGGEGHRLARCHVFTTVDARAPLPGPSVAAARTHAAKENRSEPSPSVL